MNSRHSPGFARRHFFFALIGYLAFVVYGSLVPFHYQSQPWGEAVAHFKSVLAGADGESHVESQVTTIIGRLRAILSLRESHSRSDFAANVLLFLPIGFLVLGWLSVDRSRWVALAWMPPVFILCCMLSIAIEFTQTFFPPRTPDLFDILGESVGAFLGAIAWIGFGQKITRSCRAIWSPYTTDFSQLLAGYLAFLVLVEVLPLDLTLSPVEIYHKYREGRIQLVPFAILPGDRWDWWEKQVWHVALFFPVGWLLGFRGKLGREARNWQRVIGIGLLISAFVEFLQIFVVSRNVESGDIITGSFAVLGGWLVSSPAVDRNSLPAFFGLPLQDSSTPGVPDGVVVPRGEGKVRLFVLAIWLAVIIFVNWRPFDFQFQMEMARNRVEHISWLPFADYYENGYQNFLHQVVRKTLLFVPLGLLGVVIVPVSFRGRTSLIAGFLVFLIALILEVGQIFLPTRYPSVTDIILETAGGVVGLAIAGAFRDGSRAVSSFDHCSIPRCPKDELAGGRGERSSSQTDHVLTAPQL